VELGFAALLRGEEAGVVRSQVQTVVSFSSSLLPVPVRLADTTCEIAE
jgi:hypothetical protein